MKVAGAPHVDVRGDREGDDVVRRHRVGRIVGVLVGHVGRDDGHRAGLAADEVRRRVQREASVGPPDAAAVWVPLVAQLIENQPPVDDRRAR